MKPTDLERFLGRIATGDLLTEESARDAFHERRLAVRRDLDRHPFVALERRAPLPEPVAANERRSDRLFASRAVPLRDLSRLLAAVSPEEVAGAMRRAYASAGGAYAVQVYLQVEEARLEGVPGGIYYHHPESRRLVLLSAEAGLTTDDHFPTNRPWVARAAFTILLVADLPSIRPLYGRMARDFCLVETGAMAQLLQSVAPGARLGLCQSGVVDVDRAADALGLGEGREIVAVLVGGPVDRAARIEARSVAGSVRRVESVLPPAPAKRVVEPARRCAPTAARVNAMPPTGRGSSPAAAPSRRRRELEAELSTLWRSLLGGVEIDREALFFDVGATSIIAAQALRRLQESHPGLELDVADVFAYPSIRELAGRIDQLLGPDAEEPGPESPTSPRWGEVAARAAGEGETPVSATVSSPSREATVRLPLTGAARPPLPNGERRREDARHASSIAAGARPAQGNSPEPVAIVGVAIRVSGATDPDELWELLRAGRCRVGPQPESRRALSPAFRTRPDQSFRASYLEDVEHFDPLFFHVSPKEAERIDPCQRLMLEVTADLLASSGHLGGDLAGTRTGVYVGATRSDYAALRDRASGDWTRLLSGNMTAIVANRISHAFDLSGPSVVIDTACSSSLVAVDQAARAVASAEVDAAIAGGVNLILTPEAFEAFRQDGMESPSGLCRTFDAAADGFVRGEGAAAILLRRLSDAVRDGDSIFAVIRGSATNHDGRTSSLPVPSPQAQRDVIELAHARAGTSPDEIDYVEAHGTGTKLGDPIELRGLTDAFRARSPARGACAIGSVKSNLGHLELAAGIVGLVKATLALERGRIPATLHVEEPNPHVDFPSSPFWIVDRERPWPRGARPRRASVSSFGVGGTNAHVILEEAPLLPSAANDWERPAHLVVVSAPDEDARGRALAALLAHVERHPEIEVADLAYTLATGRPALAARAAFVVRDREQLLDHLALAVAAPERLHGRHAEGVARPQPEIDAAFAERMRSVLAESTDGGRKAIRAWIPDESLDPLLGARGGDAEAPAALCRAGWIDLLGIVAELWVRGFAVDLDAYERGFRRRRVATPPLSLRRERCWWPALDPGTDRGVAASPAATPHRPTEGQATPAALPSPVVTEPPPARARIAERLRARVAEVLGIAPARVDPDQPLIEMGLDSLAATELMTTLGEWSGQEIDPTFFFDHPTIAALASGIVALASPETIGRALAAEARPAPEAEPDEPATRPVPRPAPAPVGGDPAIAIVGMAGRLPGARDLDAFWANLAGGRDSIREVPPERFDVDAIFDPDPQSRRGTYGRWGGFLDGIDGFDCRFFRIAEREARSMDPQQRLLLATAWEAIENAGHARKIRGSKTGVYVGASYTHHRDRMAREGVRFEDAHTALDTHNAILSNRVSYFLDLRGPCLTIDTLCSSSLVALHAAVRALRAGEIESAIVAGVHVDLSPGYYEAVSRLGALSPRGRCRTFDRGADGYVPGEGVVVLVLTTLERARRERDHVRALVLGTAVNHGGQSAGLTVPSPAAQAAVVRAALEDAGVVGETIGYIEAHGTGTSLGDPIEVTGLEIAIGAGGRRQFCGLGSLKSNVGHLEPAAGLASVAKVVLALEHRALPPTLHVDEPNPAIAFEDGPCFVVDRLRRWDCDRPRRGGASSFGLGGTNAHVVLEQAPPPEAPAAEPVHPSLFAISAKDDRALLALAERLLEFARGAGRAHAWTDLCFSATEGRARFARRIAVVAADRDALERGLAEAAAAIRAGRPAPRPEGASAADGFARAYLDDEDVNAASLFGGARLVPMPAYPFDERPLARRSAAPAARPSSEGEHPFAAALEPTNGGPPGSHAFLVRVGGAS